MNRNLISKLIILSSICISFCFCAEEDSEDVGSIGGNLGCWALFCPEVPWTPTLPSPNPAPPTTPNFPPVPKPH